MARLARSCGSKSDSRRAFFRMMLCVVRPRCRLRIFWYRFRWLEFVRSRGADTFSLRLQLLLVWYARHSPLASHIRSGIADFYAIWRLALAHWVLEMLPSHFVKWNEADDAFWRLIVSVPLHRDILAFICAFLEDFYCIFCRLYC